MKKQNKKNEKIMKKIKIITISLLIVLVSMIGFFGIYKQNKNQMSNVVKDYTYAMDLNGARTIKLTLNTDNSDEVKTEENYKTAKEIIEKRLKKLGVEEYKVNVNNENGEITVQIPENLNTDTIVSNLTTVGKFEILDSETNDVLLDNNSIESSKVLYNRATSGTSVYLEIAFNKDGSFRKNSSVADRAQFTVLGRYVRTKIEKIRSSILEGDARVSPYELGKKNACTYCPYMTVCGFDRKLSGYEFRRLKNFSDEELWKAFDREAE